MKFDTCRLEATEDGRSEMKDGSNWSTDAAQLWIERFSGANGAQDVITGTANADRVEGEGGNDALSGGDGADFIDGGTGDDMLLGGAGADTLMGGAGKDDIFGSAPGALLYRSAVTEAIEKPLVADGVEIAEGFTWVTFKPPGVDANGNKVFEIKGAYLWGMHYRTVIKEAANETTFAQREAA